MPTTGSVSTLVILTLLAFKVYSTVIVCSPTTIVATNLVDLGAFTGLIVSLPSTIANTDASAPFAKDHVNVAPGNLVASNAGKVISLSSEYVESIEIELLIEALTTNSFCSSVNDAKLNEGALPVK